MAPPTERGPQGPFDTDGDGLTDDVEADLGTDPSLADTDGDTYADGLEVDHDRDPLDRSDRFYKGFWPFNPGKDAMVDHGFAAGSVDVGDGFGRMVGTDQHGDQVDLYDFAASGEYIVLDASATWCTACLKTASWLSGGEDDYEYEFHYQAVREALDEGRFHWVTVLTDGGSGPATADEVGEWHDHFPHREVAVMTDDDGAVFRALNQGETYDGQPYEYFPSFAVVDSEFRVVARGFAWDALDFLLTELEPAPAE